MEAKVQSVDTQYTFAEQLKRLVAIFDFNLSRAVNVDHVIDVDSSIKFCECAKVKRCESSKQRR